jgi:hypothetical protein
LLDRKIDWLCALQYFVNVTGGRAVEIRQGELRLPRHSKHGAAEGMWHCAHAIDAHQNNALHSNGA